MILRVVRPPTDLDNIINSTLSPSLDKADKKQLSLSISYVTLYSHLKDSLQFLSNSCKPALFTMRSQLTKTQRLSCR